MSDHGENEALEADNTNNVRSSPMEDQARDSDSLSQQQEYDIDSDEESSGLTDDSAEAMVDRILEMAEVYLMDYVDEDRGTPKSRLHRLKRCSSCSSSLCALSEGFPCSIDLLNALRHNLNLLKEMSFFGSDKRFIEHDALDICTKSIASELSRLHQHPELFPSKDIEEAFWRHVYKQCDVMIEELIPAGEIHDIYEATLHESAYDREQDIWLPARDPLRKPWEQYLHNGAPGIGADLSTQGVGGSVQVFPMAAIRFVDQMVQQNRTIISAIEEVSICVTEISCFMLVRLI